MTTPVCQLASAQAPGRGLTTRFLVRGGSRQIGPESKRRDLVMRVSQGRVQSFLAFAQHEAYLAGIGHRTAAIEDSLLLPLSELPLEGAS